MDGSSSTLATALRCRACSGEFGATRLACPSCGQLVHAERLKELAARAENTADGAAAMSAWREALELLPAGSRQHAQVTERIVALSRALDAAPATRTAPRASAATWWAGAGAVLLFALGKGKLLLLGLTKASTLFTMLLSLGAYWTAFGWSFAAGLVASLYVHEMGHVAWLRRYGIAASAPMFVPGLGAFVRMTQYPAEAREDARIGLAGPTWGAAAALAFLAVGTYAGWPGGLAIAHAGAWLNLLNLAPLWQLDGARGFRALSRPQRWLACAALALAFALNGDGLFALVLLCAVVRAFGPDAPATGDRGVCAQYVILVVALALVAQPR